MTSLNTFGVDGPSVSTPLTVMDFSSSFGCMSKLITCLLWFSSIQSYLVLQSCLAKWKMPDQRALKNPYLDYNGPESSQDLFDSQGKVRDAVPL